MVWVWPPSFPSVPQARLELLHCCHVSSRVSDILVFCTKIGRGSSTDLGLGRQAVIEVKFTLRANPTISWATTLLSRFLLSMPAVVTAISGSVRIVCFSIVLQEDTNCTSGLGTGSQKLGITHRVLTRWPFPFLSKASQACKPLGFARVMGTVPREGSFTMTGWPVCSQWELALLIVRFGSVAR